MFFYTRRKHNLERKHKLLYNLQTSYAARWFSCTVFLSLQVTCSCLLVLSMHWMIHMLLYVTRSSCLLYVTHSSCLLYVTCYCRFTCTSTRQVSVQYEWRTHNTHKIKHHKMHHHKATRESNKIHRMIFITQEKSLI